MAAAEEHARKIMERPPEPLWSELLKFFGVVAIIALLIWASGQL